MKCKKNINLKKKMDEKKVYELFRLNFNSTSFTFYVGFKFSLFIEEKHQTESYQ